MTTLTLPNKLSILQIWLGKLGDKIKTIITIAQRLYNKAIQLICSKLDISFPELDTPKWLIRQWKREAEAEKRELERKIEGFAGWLR